ncbi:hypothetical protein MD484_g2224, partial [Candolleomyces efflorescens]
MQMQRLLYSPLKAATERGAVASLAVHPFLIVIDGLDECEDKDEVQDLIEGMLTFFDENPSIPLRVLITSRVEQHIQSHLNVPGVVLTNLVDHCSDDDIATFLDVLFESESRRNAVIRAYVCEHGEWPTPQDKRKLVKHIGGSFIFASTVFNFIMGAAAAHDSATTPMDRLPLTLKMNPGLDELYSQTLGRSQHLPHFLDIISTITHLEIALPTSGIAELLGIGIYEVVNVLVDLQAIIQVPGTDDVPVTFFHTSLRDFLSTQSRSGPFFAHPRQHVRLFILCLQCELAHCQRIVESPTTSSQRKPGAAYALQYAAAHLRRVQHLFEPVESGYALQLCHEALVLNPGAPELIHSLALVTQMRANHGGTLVELEEAVSLNRAALKLRPLSHPDRSQSLRTLGDALMGRYGRKGRMNDLEEAITLYREELKLQPSPHPDDRPHSLNDLGLALRVRYQRTAITADIEEAITLFREALESQPYPHQDRSESINNLGLALWDRYRRTGCTEDLWEATNLHREALDLRPCPHPDRSLSLNNLGLALWDRYRVTRTVADLEAAISLHCKALELRPSPHPDRSQSLGNLANALGDRYHRKGDVADLEEAISMLRETVKLQPSPHSFLSLSLNSLGLALLDRFQLTADVGDLEETISLLREALKLRPFPHLHRAWSLRCLVMSLERMYNVSQALPYLQEAILCCEELLTFHCPVGHQDRLEILDRLAALLQKRSTGATGQVEDDLDYIAKLKTEARQIRELRDGSRSTESG